MSIQRIHESTSFESIESIRARASRALRASASQHPRASRASQNGWVRAKVQEGNQKNAPAHWLCIAFSGPGECYRRETVSSLRDLTSLTALAWRKWSFAENRHPDFGHLLAIKFVKSLRFQGRAARTGLNFKTHAPTVHLKYLPGPSDTSSCQVRSRLDCSRRVWCSNLDKLDGQPVTGSQCLFIGWTRAEEHLASERATDIRHGHRRPDEHQQVRGRGARMSISGSAQQLVILVTPAAAQPSRKQGYKMQGDNSDKDLRLSEAAPPRRYSHLRLLPPCCLQLASAF